MANISSNNLTSLYGGNQDTVITTTVVPNVAGTIPSKNLTTLYSGSGAPVTATTPYGNANVERFLSIGTDGGNTVTNINMAGDLTVGGLSNLGNVGNVTITGGTLNYVLQTDGAGGLSWVEQIGANTVNGSEFIHFDVVTTGNNQTFSNANIALYSSNVNMNVMKNGINIEPSLFVKTGSTTIQVNILLNAGDTIDILAAAGGGGGSGTPGGNITQIQYNGGGVFSANASFTFDQPNSLMTVGNINTGNIISSGGTNTTSVIHQFAPNSVVIPSNSTNNTAYDVATLYSANVSLGNPATVKIRSRGNVTTPATAVSGDRITQTRDMVYNGNTNVLAVTVTSQASGTVNANANAVYTGGLHTISTGNPAGDTGNSSNNSGLNSFQFVNSGGLIITPGTAPNTSLGQTTTSSLALYNYGRDTSNLVQVGGLNFLRARGNRDSNLNVQAGDQIGRSVFVAYSNGAFQSTNSAQWRTVVDSSYANNDTIVPMSHQFQTVANVANVATFLTTSFYSNGVANFPGDIKTIGSANVGSLNVTGVSNLGANGNVIITGGSAGQALVTNGSGNLSWGNVANSANSNYANFAGTAFSVAGANVTGFVSNASYANYATIAFSVSGANVTGTVASATIAASANSVNVANVVGIGNIAVINLNGNANTVLAGNGGWIPQLGGSGNGVPAGPNGAVQINGGFGVFGNITGFTADSSGLSVTGNVQATGNLFANTSMIANTFSYAPIAYTPNLIVWTSNSNTTTLFTAAGSNVGVTGNLNATGNIFQSTGTANLNNLVVSGTSTFNNTVTYNAPIVGLPSLSIDSFDDGGVFNRSLNVLTQQVAYDTTPFNVNHPLAVSTANMQVYSSANLQYVFYNGLGNTYYMTPITYPGVTANVHWAGGSAPSTGVANAWNVYSFNVICTAANTVEIFASTSTY
jgi:hypothetical protein